jgi:hypothetical protein
VLAQTLADFELVVVVDGSTDETVSALAAFDDARLRYVTQPNAGVSAARNSGIALTSAEYIAFLDDDDYYHPEFLERLVRFLDAEPEVGLVYTSRIEVDRDGLPLRFNEPPTETSLEDMVRGFPFALSDCVMRRSLVERAGGFDPSFTINEDRVLFARLALSGCRFVRASGVLSRRRRYAGRIVTGLEAKMDDMRRSIAVALDDPRCPPHVRAHETAGYHRILLEWTYQACFAGDADLARSYFAEALAIDPPPGDAFIRRAFTAAATRNGEDPEPGLRSAYACVLSDRDDWQALCDEAVADACLRRGVCELLWARLDTGRDYVTRARAIGTPPSERFRETLDSQLRCYETAYGADALRTAVERLGAQLEPFGVTLPSPDSAPAGRSVNRP